MRCSSERTINSGLVLKLCTLAMTWLRCSRLIVSAIVAKDNAIGWRETVVERVAFNRSS